MTISKLTLADKQQVNAYFDAYQPHISEYTFTSLCAWNSSRPIYYYDSGTGIAFLIKQDDKVILFGDPLGTMDFEKLCFYSKQTLGAAIVSGKRIHKKFSTHCPSITWTRDPDYDDYMYNQSDLALLPGNRFHKKKNLIHKCDHLNWSYEPISNEIIPEIETFMHNWYKHKQCQVGSGLWNEFQALSYVLSHYNQLAAFGGLIRIDGQIEAFTIGEKLNSKTGVIHFEKANTAYTGLYQLINREFAKRTLENFKFINREPDMGIPGLKQAKHSYHPSHMIEKYRFTCQ